MNWLVLAYNATKQTSLQIGPIPIAGGAADLTIRVPNIAVSSITNGNVQGPVIQAYKEQPLVTLTGNLERLIPFVGTILTDVTEFRRLREQLHHAQKMETVGQLTGGIAHDFNNLLTVVLGNIELLMEGLSASPSLARTAW